MLFRLLLIFTVVPLVELALLVELAQRTSVAATFTLVLATGFLGAWLARREGVKALTRIQSELHAGAMPTDAMLDGALIVLAGVVLVTPGMLTDLIGFALLVPPIRGTIKKRLADALRARVVHINERGPAPFVDVTATSYEAEANDDTPPSSRSSDRHQIDASTKE